MMIGIIVAGVITVTSFADIAIGFIRVRCSTSSLRARTSALDTNLSEVSVFNLSIQLFLVSEIITSQLDVLIHHFGGGHPG